MKRRDLFKGIAAALGALLIPFTSSGKDLRELLKPTPEDLAMREFDGIFGPHSQDEPLSLEHGTHHYGSVALKMRDESELFNPLLVGQFEAQKILTTKLYNTVEEVIIETKTGREIDMKRFYSDSSYLTGKRLIKYERKGYLMQYMGIEFTYRTEEEYAKNKRLALLLLAAEFSDAVTHKLVHRGCLLPCSSLELASFDGVRREALLLWPLGCENFNLKRARPIFLEEGQRTASQRVRAEAVSKGIGDPRWTS